MKLHRRQLAASALAVGLFVATPAFAGPDEDAVGKSLEAFRAAQFAADGKALDALSAPELSYSHSSGTLEDKAAFLAGATSGKNKMISLEYKDPIIKVVGNVAIVRFNWKHEALVVADNTKSTANLHILMAWQKQGNDWKLLARSATKL